MKKFDHVVLAFGSVKKLKRKAALKLQEVFRRKRLSPREYTVILGGETKINVGFCLRHYRSYLKSDVLTHICNFLKIPVTDIINAEKYLKDPENVNMVLYEAKRKGFDVKDMFENCDFPKDWDREMQRKLVAYIYLLGEVSVRIDAMEG